MGSTTNKMAGLAYRKMTDAPERPAMRPDQYPVTGRFTRKLDGTKTKWMTYFYDAYRQYDRALNDYKKIKDTQGAVEAAEYAAEHKGEIAAARAGSRVRRKLSKLAKLSKAIYSDRSLSAEEKRIRIDRINQYKSQIAKIGYYKISEIAQ